mmetsp:Transcript_13185/g.20539  ORF Transcript_13185/g.20539 Transcript_13185/m.20539 type:complete len:147 (+) Transcript_13185:205-645(+)
MITFIDSDSASNAIKLFTNKKSTDKKGQSAITVAPFEEKNESKKAGLFNRRVYLTNLNGDVTEFELRQLCQEIAPVDQVHVARDVNGQSKGYAFIFMKNAKDVKSLVNFVQGREIDGQEIVAKSSLGGAQFNKTMESECNVTGLSE